MAAGENTFVSHVKKWSPSHFSHNSALRVLKLHPWILGGQSLVSSDVLGLNLKKVVVQSCICTQIKLLTFFHL